MKAFVYTKAGKMPNPEYCFLVSKDADEITAVVREENLDKVDVLVRNKDSYRLIELKVSLPFYAVGFLAAVTKAISAKGVNNLLVSTYSKDYVLVRAEQLGLACEALVEGGFSQG